MGIPLCVICCFSLAAFNIYYLCLIFVNLINMFLGVFHLGYILLGTLFGFFLDLGDYFLPHFRKVFNYYLLKYFLRVLLSSSSGTSMIQMLGCLTLSWRSLRLSSFLVIHFSFFLSDSFICTILSSNSLILSSATVILLFVSLSVFYFIYCIIHYILTLFYFFSVQFIHSVVSDSLRPHESQHTRPPCPSPTPGVHSDSRPTSQ